MAPDFVVRQGRNRAPQSMTACKTLRAKVGYALRAMTHKADTAHVYVLPGVERYRVFFLKDNKPVIVVTLDHGRVVPRPAERPAVVGSFSQRVANGLR